MICHIYIYSTRFKVKERNYIRSYIENFLSTYIVFDWPNEVKSLIAIFLSR